MGLPERERQPEIVAADNEAMRRIRAVSEATMIITSELALDKILQKIVDTARDLVNARYAALGVADEERRRLTTFVVSGLTRQEIEAIGPWPRGLGLLGLLLKEPRPVRVKNIAQDPRAIGLPPHHPQMTSFMGVPVISKGRVLGNFYLTDKIGRDEFSQDDEDLLVLFAAQAAVAIENAHLYTQTSTALQDKVRQLERSTRQTSFLADLGVLLPSGPLAKGLQLQPVAERLTEQLADACGIYLVDEKDPATVESSCMYHPNVRRKEEAEDIVERAWPWLKELVIGKRQAILVPLAEDGQSALGAIRIPGENSHRFTGIMAVPIADGDKCYGLLVSLSSQPLELTKEDIRFASLVSDRLAIAAENSRLYQDRARLAAIVESSNDAIYGRTLDGVITSWNPAAEQLYGHGAAEVIGQSLSMIFPPDRADELADILDKTRKGERIENFETVRVRKDGKRIDVAVTVSPIKDMAGRLIGVSTIARDVTERKRMEQALRDSEAKYRSLYAAVEAAIIETDAEGRMTDVNDRGLEIGGWTRDQVIGKLGTDPRWQLVRADGSPMPTDEIPTAAVLRTGRSVKGVVLGYLAADRQRHWVLVNVQPLFDQSTVAIVGTLSTYMDITELKRLEEALRKARDDLEARVVERTAELQGANEQLREANEKLIVAAARTLEQAALARRRASELEATIESIADGVFICDMNGQIVGVNKAGLRLIGLTRIEGAIRPLAGYLTLLQLRSPGGRPLAMEELALSRALRGEIVVGFEEIARSLHTQRDINLLVSAAPIRDRDGHVTGVIAVMSNITQIRELDRLKDEFILVAAHELKTPVTIMKGYAQALLRAAEALTPPQHKMLDAINRGADKIDGIVKDLLDVSRLHAGRLELTLERIDLLEMAEEVVDRMALTFTKRHIQIVRGEPLIAVGDRDRLEQVLTNLLNNAITYSPKGGDIEVAIATQAQEAVVSVIDHGVGIPKDKQERIFERFYRAHTRTPYDYGGMGVGLYLSREIISRHGGRMWFESAEDKGSTFYFSLPLPAAAGHEAHSLKA